MKKVFSAMLSIVLLLGAFNTAAFAAYDQTGLTMDGKPATIDQIEKITGYDFLDENGNYAPMYYESAKKLWEKGLFHGSDGSFNLDKPITRIEGIIMTLRLLGLEDDATSAKLACKFTDVPDWAKYFVAYAAQKGISSGYSETVFGSSDPMTANQYLTFVLRAMGYEDGTDFNWKNAADKAVSIGLIGEPCHIQYTRSNLFLRDNVAVISLNALESAPMKSGKYLVNTIELPGKPSGTVPSAMQIINEVPAEKPIKEPLDPSDPKYNAPVVTRDTIGGDIVSIEIMEPAESIIPVSVDLKYKIIIGRSTTVGFTFAVNDNYVAQNTEYMEMGTYVLDVTLLASGESNGELQEKPVTFTITADGGIYTFAQNIDVLEMGKIDSFVLTKID